MTHPKVSWAVVERDIAMRRADALNAQKGHGWLRFRAESAVISATDEQVWGVRREEMDPERPELGWHDRGWVL